MLFLLMTVNLLNYLDRQVLYAVLPNIQKELSMSDAQAGSLASAFMVVYMIAAPPIGYLADRFSRSFWITVGVAFGACATLASGFSYSFAQLFAARAAAGIGESCYGAPSPSFLAEHYPPARRGWVLALFSMAIPVGSALGYVTGGALGQAWGWRPAFFAVAAAGLLLSVFTARLKDPVAHAKEQAAPEQGGSAVASYLALFKIPSFAMVTLAGAAMTFALGGFAVWMPSYFHRAWGLSLAQAGTLFGAVTVLSGIIGSLLGGWSSDRLLKATSKAHFLVSGAGLLLGMPLAALALLAPSLHLAVAALFVAEIFLFLNMGPLNAIIVSVARPSVRSMAFAANIFVIHALGDAISPTLIGAASDRWGLKAALLGSCAFLGLASGFCAWGTRTYDRDAQAAGEAA